MLRDIEGRIKAELGRQPEVTAIESIRHEGVKHWTELGIKRKYSGTTRTVFLSTVTSASISATIIAILSIVIPAIIAAIWAFMVWTVSSTVKDITTAAPSGVGTLAFFAVIGLAIYAYMKRK